jgi:hypothetical protein
MESRLSISEKSSIFPEKCRAGLEEIRINPRGPEALSLPTSPISENVIIFHSDPS